MGNSAFAGRVQRRTSKFIFVFGFFAPSWLVPVALNGWPGSFMKSPS
jgi:hypothetical protein